MVFPSDMLTLLQVQQEFPEPTQHALPLPVIGPNGANRLSLSQCGLNWTFESALFFRAGKEGSSNRCAPFLLASMLLSYLLKHANVESRALNWKQKVGMCLGDPTLFNAGFSFMLYSLWSLQPWSSNLRQTILGWTLYGISLRAAANRGGSSAVIDAVTVSVFAVNICKQNSVKPGLNLLTMTSQRI